MTTNALNIVFNPEVLKLTAKMFTHFALIRVFNSRVLKYVTKIITINALN